MLRILFVTSSPAAVDRYQRHLESFGCDFDTVAAGPGALSGLDVARYDGVVAIDAGASAAGAEEVVRQVRATHPWQVVLAMAPEPGPDRRRELIETGAASVLPINCTPNQFVRGLISALLET